MPKTSLRIQKSPGPPLVLRRLSANYRSKVAKIRQLNVNEAYFRPTKNEDCIIIIMYFVTTNGGKLTTDAAVRGQKISRFLLIIYMLNSPTFPTSIPVVQYFSLHRPEISLDNTEDQITYCDHIRGTWLMCINDEMRKQYEYVLLDL